MIVTCLRAGVAGAVVLIASASPTLSQTFPLTVAHEMGETSIAAKPERVVSIGVHEQDFLYALGVAPVGVHEWWGGYPYATWPWAEEARIAVGAEPAVLSGWEINVEWVASLQPDLIVASYFSDLDQATYDLLSEVAPVITAPPGFPAWGAPWQAELQLLAEVTGTSAKAAEIIADLDARIAAARAEYPQLQGKTAATVYFFDNQFRTYNSSDTAHRFLQDFGLVIPPAYDELAAERGHIDVSPENIELIDLDLIILGGEPAVRDQVEGLTVYQATRASREGRAFWIGDGVASGALSFQTPLSLEYLIEVFPPVFAAAVDGDPATEVPEVEL